MDVCKTFPLYFLYFSCQFQLLYNPELRKSYADRIAKQPTEANIRALLNSPENRQQIKAIIDNYKALGEVPDETDIIRAVLRHHWQEKDYDSPATKQLMKLHYYNGVMSYLKREIKRYFVTPDIAPLMVEFAFALDGSIEVDGKEEKYRFRGVFDRIEGYGYQ